MAAFSKHSKYFKLGCYLQFVDGTGRLLSTAEQSSTSGWFSRDDTSKAGLQRSLRAYMESFITEKFLPEVYLDFRYTAYCVHVILCHDRRCILNSAAYCFPC